MEFEVLLQYSLPIIVMAVIVMVLVGIVKVFIKPKFSNVWLSRMYFLLALLFSVGVVAFYNGVILKLPLFTNFQSFMEIGSVIGATQILYPLYRKYGGRKFFLWFISLFKGINKNTDKIIAIVEKILNENVVLVDKQKEKIHKALEVLLKQ